MTILTSPKNALVKQYQRLFEMEDVKLKFSENALEAVAEKAVERKTGARGLRSILEDILLDTMFEFAGARGCPGKLWINRSGPGGRAASYIYSDRRDDMDNSA